MVIESSVDTQLSKELNVNSTCIEVKDSGVNNQNQNNVGADSDCVHATIINKDNSVETNGSGISGSKRARMSSEDRQAAVHVKYEFMSRESKKKLEELLSEWSKWHAAHCSSTKDSCDALESGGETYYPALHCGTENTAVSYLMETQSMKKQKTECLSLNCDSVPLYDREYEFALKLTDGSNEEDRSLNPLNASRCFNCGTYGHSLKECPKPRDSLAVSNARKEHQLKKNFNGGPHLLTRYYQHTPRGKYDGLKPGALGAETRKALGLVEFDPPPWLNRMRELGYPPGYLDIEDGDQPSGITIFDDDESCKQKGKINEVGVLEPGRTRSVSFPGINAPIPEGADQSRWEAPPLQQCINSSAYHSNQWSNCSPDLHSRMNSFSHRSTNGFFSNYAQELDSLFSNYSGYSHYKKPDCGANSDSTLLDGFSRLRGQHTPGFSPGNGNYGPNYSSANSDSTLLGGFSRLRGQHTPGFSPGNGNYGPNYSSRSNLMDGFSGDRGVHQFDARPGDWPSANNRSHFSISPNLFAYSRQL